MTPEEQQSLLFGREICDPSESQIEETKRLALEKILPARIASAETIMNLSPECVLAEYERLFKNTPREEQVNDT